LEEFKTKLSNCWLEQAVTPFKNQLELFIENGEESFRLIFNASPGNAALFLDSYRPAKKSNTQNFFESVYGIPIKDIILEENERLISFLFEDGHRLWFKLFGSKANAILAKEGIIVETFKDRDSIGDNEPVPNSPKLLDINSIQDANSEVRLQKLLPILPKAWLRYLNEIHHFDNIEDDELLSFAVNLDSTLKTIAEFRILENGDVTLIPEKILPDNADQKVESVNDLILHRFKNFAHQQRLQSQKNGLVKSIKRQIKRLESALTNLYKADKGLEKADTYEKFGHILMANAHQSVSRTKKIELDDLYNIGEKVSIPLVEDISIAENAQRYYSKSSNSLKSYEEALERIPELERRLNTYEELLSGLLEINQMRELTNWKKEKQQYLVGLEQGSKSNEEPTNAFYVLEYKGYNLWIGKNARSNDIVVQKSHKEDMWLHVRGVSGSHVVVRMNNSKNEPDLDFIEEVASFAAYQSKAKGSNLVPVIYTKRKYVRKPKGAALGAVLVQKEKVAIVEPKDPFQ
jgi:predicted ribosome quality control (RQC) complex YloA/Tae2 family protein